MATKSEILDAALQVIRGGEALTLDAVAKRAGLTKPGVVHHFPTKEVLTVSVVDRVIDLWEADLQARIEEPASSTDRLRAYVEFSLTADLDPSDLALLADVRLREQLSQQWLARLGVWFDISSPRTPEGRARLQAARLLADGAWFDRALGLVQLDESQLRAVWAVAQDLIDEGEKK